jgi:hypothetical protein
MIRAIAVLIALTLGACAATGPVFSPVQGVPEDHGVVYVYRLDHFANKVIRPGITVDGQEYPALPAGGYIPFLLKEGEHAFDLVLKDYEGTATVKTTVTKGSESFLRLETFNQGDSQTLTRVFRLVPVPAAYAVPEVKECKLIDPKTGKRYSKSLLEY